MEGMPQSCGKAWCILGSAPLFRASGYPERLSLKCLAIEML